MKNLKFILLIAVISLFIGCSSDDDSGGQINSSIIGTWNATNVDAGGEISTSFSNQIITRPINGEPKNLNYSITFNEDNTVTATGNFDLDFTVSFLDQIYNETLENVAPVGVGTWSLSGNNLSITSEGETQVITIEELSANLMTLFASETESSSIDGQDFDIELDIRMFFDKQ